MALISYFLSPFTDEAKNLPPLASFSYESFNKKHTPESGSYPLYGKLIIYNTIENFRNVNKNDLLQNYGKDMRKMMSNESITTIPEMLSQFLLITFADLKKYQYHYWFAFPVFQSPKSILLQTPKQLQDIWKSEQINIFQQKLSEISEYKKAYFLTFFDEETEDITIHSFDEYRDLQNKNGKLYFSFADPCPNPHYPGWPLRNLLAFINIRYKVDACQVISYRLQSNSCGQSLIFDVKMVNECQNEVPACIGWEKNEKQKLGPKYVDLSSTFDPKRLAESAVDLNLKLMRWRLVPDLDLQKISATKCLLLGAGTLGCNVARCLMAWGVKNITLVDNGKVSYSNPVRQSLFEFQDCLDSGKLKAEAAVDGLKRIYPCMNAAAVVMTIPMPGHPIPSMMINEVKKDVETLEQLIASHDCTFLLMDTRESRWLPTVVCQSKRKLVVNAALGFDTYLVQRHGVRRLSTDGQEDEKEVHGDRLGCYFCNDVVAPGDSTRHRTLDQQCTVTRPGVSMLAAGLAVELMVSVIQHPQGINAPATHTDDNEDPFSESCFGIVPHQIRGFLSQFSQLMLANKAFNCCTACSQSVVDAYEKDGFDFLLKVFADTDFLETMTGLKKLHQEVDVDDVWALSDGESE